ncbi:ABC-2 type transporter family [Synechococcus sp. PCC 7335]|uniref:ABC transporter permease n=1 Tax=Synechococcus sp. (strain ATCC 29403 / PCC 7335) TaxID=91464 RepID=UPI00017ED9D4|nr:ABC transporter permease [Synechococcus sp. PCC 7335]EDX83316.1 ABC-2 type transporter family [Synechococcus sp. PCC 7335]
MNLLRSLLDTRLWPLILKEVRQILKNKQIIFLLLFPPTIQLLVFGLALNPDVSHLSLGVVDYNNSPASRDFVAALVANDSFDISGYPTREADLGRQVRKGEISTGLVIPPDFDRRLTAGKSVDVQVLIDGVDANTAGIASGYIKQIINRYGLGLKATDFVPPVQTAVNFLYNPGLLSSWFFVPGVMGVVLTLTGSLVSSATVIREKDVGTLEQLLMTPAAGWEILTAKVVPLFVLLMGDVLLASALGRFVFNLPFRSNYFLFLALSGIYVFVAIGIGILIATIARNQQQVILTSFFFNVPLIQLSGAIAPIESMPKFFRVLSFFNPLRHYVTIARSLILKGVGISALLPEVTALVVFATLLLGLSIYRFRAQLN